MDRVWERQVHIDAAVSERDKESAAIGDQQLQLLRPHSVGRVTTTGMVSIGEQPDNGYITVGESKGFGAPEP